MHCIDIFVALGGSFLRTLEMWYESRRHRVSRSFMIQLSKTSLQAQLRHKAPVLHQPDASQAWLNRKSRYAIKSWSNSEEGVELNSASNCLRTSWHVAATVARDAAGAVLTVCDTCTRHMVDQRRSSSHSVIPASSAVDQHCAAYWSWLLPEQQSDNSPSLPHGIIAISGSLRAVVPLQVPDPRQYVTCCLAKTAGWTCTLPPWSQPRSQPATCRPPNPSPAVSPASQPYQ